METGWTWPFPVDDITMPSLWSIVGALFEPVQADGELLISYLFDSALFTAKEAALGFAIGTIVGFSLGALIAQFRVLQRGLMPYMVASQTMPILAIAPMVVVGFGKSRLRLDADGLAPRGDHRRIPDVLPRHGQHACVASSRPTRRAMELMRSYAASNWSDLLAAAHPVVDAVPVRRVQDRRDRKRRRRDHRRAALVDPGRPRRRDPQLQPVLRRSSPQNLWATNLIAAALGIAFFLVVVIAERLVVHRPPEQMV